MQLLFVPRSEKNFQVLKMRVLLVSLKVETNSGFETLELKYLIFNYEFHPHL